MPFIAKLLLALDRRAAGLRQRTMQVDDHRIVYAEGGRGEAVLMLHGFGASQGSWTRMAKALTRRYHVIAPDLPGWGESTRIAGASYAYPEQVERVHRFVQTLKLERFHLAGHSMGGGVAARYAAMYPEQVITLCLLAPHGIREPQDSELRRATMQGRNWLLVSSPDEFETLMRHVFVKRPFAPRPVARYLEQDAMRKYEHNRKIFDDLQQTDPPLLKVLPEIKIPTLVIWGDKDLLIHCSAAEVFQKEIQNARTCVLTDCGHMPLVERGRECAEAYIAFLDDQRKESLLSQEVAAILP